MMNPFGAYNDAKNEPSEDPRLGAMARDLVFNAKYLNPDSITQAVERAKATLGTKPLGSNLKNLQEAFLGVAAHEAIEWRYAEWNANLSKMKYPERLTREEVQAKFAQFSEAETLQLREEQALGHFTALLQEDPDFSVATSENTRFDAIDIRTYIIDIKNRIAERLSNDTERRQSLAQLDTELAELIKSVPEEQWGKKLELQELFLLRQLIHRADMGHLAHVGHGTLREDLRADFGSVDLRLFAAGDVYNYQVKTFRVDASREAKASQFNTVIKKKQQTEDSGTHFVILQTDRVQVAYDRAIRQQNSTGTQTVGDKFEALRPLTDGLNGSQRARLLHLVGFNESILAEEQEKFDAAQKKLNEHLEATRAKAAMEAEKQAAVIAERRRLEAEENEAHLAAIRAQEELQESQRELSASERERIAKEKNERLEAKAKQKAKERAALALAQTQQQKVIEKKLSAKASKERSKLVSEWVLKRTTELMKPASLIEAGYLDASKKNNVPDILAAKKQAEAIYTRKYVLEHYPYPEYQQIENPAAE